MKKFLSSAAHYLFQLLQTVAWASAGGFVLYLETQAVKRVFSGDLIMGYFLVISLACIVAVAYCWDQAINGFSRSVKNPQTDNWLQSVRSQVDGGGNDESANH